MSFGELGVEREPVILKNAYSERSGWNLVGRISRYVMDIAVPVPLSLGELGGGKPNSEKLEKSDVFLPYERVIGSQWNLIFRRTSCLRALIFNPDRMQWYLRELEETGNLGIRLEWRDRDDTWWEEWTQVLDTLT